jgi:Outer membrane protein beta-barrel domain
MHHRIVFFTMASLLTLSFRAGAQQPAGGDEPSTSSGARTAANERGLRGLELAARPGYGSAGDKSPVSYRQAPFAYHPDPGGIFDGTAAPYGTGFAGQLGLGYRFLPFASAGVYGELRRSSASNPSDGSSELSRSGWGAGFYARAYAPTWVERFDPYLEIGVGYMNDTQSYRRGVFTTIGSMPGDWKLEHHGVAVPLAIGIDYRVLPSFALGPSFRYARVFAAGGCLSESVDTPLGAVSNKSCTDASDNQRITEAQSYGVWSAGLDARVTL